MRTMKILSSTSSSTFGKRTSRIKALFIRYLLTVDSSEPLAEKPIKAGMPDQKPEIPKKPKKEAAPTSNGVHQTNGKHALEDDEVVIQTSKRPRDEDVEARGTKKAKVAIQSSEDDDVVLVDDEAGGAIVID